MTEVGAYEAKTHLPRLLERVARGERIAITKHGVPVAMLVPAPTRATPPIAETIAALRAFRRSHRLGQLTLKRLIEAGRA